MNAGSLFLKIVEKQFNDQQMLIIKTLDQVNEEEVHRVIGEENNSIAILLQHMHGNMLSRFTDFLTSDGEKPSRQRDQEFEDQEYTKEKLMQMMEEGWTIVLETIHSLKPEDVTATVYIRHQPHSVMDAINRQVAHFAYHTGQIVLLAKTMVGPKWLTLTIPKGGTAAFNAEMEKQYKAKQS